MVADVSADYVPLAYAYSSSYGTQGRISVPVAPSEVIYASFEHVTGVPAATGGDAASIDSLKILDMLIERLSSIKRQPLAALEAPSSLSPGRVDALIEQYGRELHALASAPPRPYAPRVASSPGILFSLAA
jgi:hypothetical protein